MPFIKSLLLLLFKYFNYCLLLFLLLVAAVVTIVVVIICLRFHNHRCILHIEIVVVVVVEFLAAVSCAHVISSLIGIDDDGMNSQYLMYAHKKLERIVFFFSHMQKYIKHTAFSSLSIDRLICSVDISFICSLSRSRNHSGAFVSMKLVKISRHQYMGIYIFIWRTSNIYLWIIFEYLSYLLLPIKSVATAAVSIAANLTLLSSN